MKPRPLSRRGSQATTQGKASLAGQSRCKGPEGGRSSALFENSREASAAATGGLEETRAS